MVSLSVVFSFLGGIFQRASPDDTDIDEPLPTPEVDPKPELAPDEFAADEVAPNMVAPDAVGADEVGADEVGADEVGADAVGADEVGADEVGADEIGIEEAGAVKVADVKVAADKIAADKVAADKVAADKVGADEAAAEKYGGFFDKIDSDGDGFIAKSELDAYVEKCGQFALLELGIGRWETFAEEIDLNGDGKVCRDEFIAFFSVGNPELDPDRVYGALFDVLDVSKDGVLQQQELEDFKRCENPFVFSLFGVADYEEFVHAMDANDDANVSRDEFICCLKGKIGASGWEIQAWKEKLQKGSHRASTSNQAKMNVRPRLEASPQGKKRRRR